MTGPRVLVFDSGLGGLTVLAEIAKARPDAALTYVADTAWFPYGGRGEAEVIGRVVEVIGGMLAGDPPLEWEVGSPAGYNVVVIACNTASTLVLPALREAFRVPFVGTVPAIKPAAAATRSGMVSVLATPGTVARDYTRALIETFAADVDVTLVGAPGLAALAEAALRGKAADQTAITAEIAPAFVERDGRRTDTVVLACTHYPLILDWLTAAAPWEVTWIDPAPAIARRVASLIGDRPMGDAAGPGRAVLTGGVGDGLGAVLDRYGLEEA